MMEYFPSIAPLYERKFMKKQLCFLLFIPFMLAWSTPLGAESPIVGEWVSVERSRGGLGSAKTYTADNIVQATFGALVDFKYQLDGNKVVLSFPGADDIVQKVEIKDTKMILTSEPTGSKQELTRVGGDQKSGIIGKWTGDHYTGGKQILHFTAAKNCYLSVPMISGNGTYQSIGDNLTESFEGQKNAEWKWAIHDDVLTLTNKNQGKTEKYMRKK
jgi:hypothetical protein